MNVTYDDVGGLGPMISQVREMIELPLKHPELFSRLGEDIDLNALAARTDGFTGADLENLARRAGLHALRADTDADEVPMRFFEQVLKETRASVTPDMEKEYERMVEQLKQENPRGSRQIGFALPQNSE